MKSLRTAKLFITLAIIVLVASAFLLSGQAQAEDNQNKLNQNGLVNNEDLGRNDVESGFAIRRVRRLFERKTFGVNGPILLSDHSRETGTVSPGSNIVEIKLLDNGDERAEMRDKETRAALAQHWSDIENQDVVHEIYHEDVVVEFPQSGERFLGLANLRAMREAYPAKVSATIRQSRGGGDFWVTELVLTYDGKKQVNAVSIMEFRGDRVARETLYFGDPWEPPAWRAKWVEQKK